MSPWKNRLVVLTTTLLSVSFPIFLVTGYAALYWAWVRGNLAAALPFLPWARNFGMLAMAGAAAFMLARREGRPGLRTLFSPHDGDAGRTKSRG